ncbi:hypothetical protein BHE74_00015646 [Ensete ventricosum]|nr:hypothetical protein BHE74_00015646 [Ensete ventricosum]
MVEEVCVGWGQGHSTILPDAAVVMPIGGSSVGVKGHCVDATRLEGSVSGTMVIKDGGRGAVVRQGGPQVVKEEDDNERSLRSSWSTVRLGSRAGRQR